MKLSLDTSDTEVIRVALEKDCKRSEKTVESHKQKSQAVLFVIEDILMENDAQICDITHIYVKRGPGSYTGLRVGVSVANALSYLLHIPINDGKPGSIVTPIYENSLY